MDACLWDPKGYYLHDTEAFSQSLGDVCKLLSQNVKATSAPKPVGTGTSVGDPMDN